MFRPLLFLVPLCPLVAAAQVPPLSVRALGMAGAVRGDPVGNSAVVGNPAGMARSYLYSAEASYVRAAPGYNAAGLNVVDSKTQPALAVGLAYAYQFTDGDQPIDDGHDARLAFAHAFVQQVFSVGIGLHYVHIDREAAEEKDEKVRTFTLDAGLLLSPSPAFHIGLVGHNLIATENPLLPRQMGGGVAYTGEFLTLDADVLADFDRGEKTVVVVQTGLETIIGGVVPFRLGFELDGATEQKWVGGGVGFLDTRTRKEGNQLNIAFKQNLDQTDAWVFSGGLVMFM